MLPVAKLDCWRKKSLRRSGEAKEKRRERTCVAVHILDVKSVVYMYTRSDRGSG